ncbi:MAG: chitobiase/beta-hexosaminidase C-terminal domain-containing protein [Victivallales bacterium]|nr:chitobiase/beta-hexosaminidase C-terminal domain-containing protein [Victivallales bacterium]
MRIWFRLILCVLAVCACRVQGGFSLQKQAEIADALDCPPDVILLGGKNVEFRRTNGQIDEENPIQKNEEDCRWTVQTEEYLWTKPIVGNSCIRSTIGTGEPKYDARYITLTFQVTGAGVFSFYYKTSTKSAKDSDYLTVLVDGEQTNFVVEGMDETGDGSNDWADEDGEPAESNYVSVFIDGGVVDISEGDPRLYVHTGYDALREHEITFQFYKDEPMYTSFHDEDGSPRSHSYVPDGPVMPVKPKRDDFKGKDVTKAEAEEKYQEALAEYYAAVEAYNTALPYFGNCVWLDGIEWEPIEPELSFFEDEFVFEDEGAVTVEANEDELEAFLYYSVDGTYPTPFNEASSCVSGDEIEFTTSCRVFVVMYPSETVETDPIALLRADCTVVASPPTLESETLEDGTVRVTASIEYDANLVRYTTDGSDPTEKSPVMGAGGVILTQAATVRAICTRKGVTPSEVVELEVEQCAVPVVTCYDGTAVETGGLYTGDALTVVAVSEDGDDLEYSLNGGEWTEYAAPLALTDGQTCTIRAVWVDSVASESVSVTARKADASAVWKAGELSSGWNLLGIPMELTDASRNALFAWQVMRWDVATGTYVHADTVPAGEAVMVFVPGGNTLSLELHGKNVKVLPPSGWSLWAPPKRENGVSYWKWDAGRFVAVPASKFVAGNGYLVNRP